MQVLCWTMQKFNKFQYQKFLLTALIIESTFARDFVATVTDATCVEAFEICKAFHLQTLFQAVIKVSKVSRY
jgi:hypothetical protein